MEGDAFLALLRLTLNEDPVVANLAAVALRLAKGIRDAEARADLAEAALVTERARSAGFAAALERDFDAAGVPEKRDPLSSIRITRQTSVVLDIQ